MRHHATISAAILLALTLGLALSAPLQAQEMDKATKDAVKLGFTMDKTAALATAARDQKPLLAFFTTDW